MGNLSKEVITGIIVMVVGTLILGALGLNSISGPSPSPSPSPDDRAPQPDPAPKPEPEPVTFDITTQLSPGQVNGLARVTIDGESAGVLTIDQANPIDEISHTVPDTGTYSYTIEATGVLQDAYGATYQLNGNGQGNIQVDQGSDFVLSGNISGNTWQVSLVED